MKRAAAYVVVLEKADSNWSAYVPDLPGCVAASATAAETRKLIREAIDFHLEGMELDGLPIPPPTARTSEVAVPKRFAKAKKPRTPKQTGTRRARAS